MRHYLFLLCHLWPISPLSWWTQFDAEPSQLTTVSPDHIVASDRKNINRMVKILFPRPTVSFGDSITIY